jgi:prevent-host-death family protein
MDDQSPSPARIINAVKARDNFGQMLDEVYYKGDQFIIERAGRPMAAVVPLSVLEEWQKHSGPAKAEHDTNKGNKRQPKKRRS